MAAGTGVVAIFAGTAVFAAVLGDLFSEHAAAKIEKPTVKTNSVKIFVFIMSGAVTGGFFLRILFLQEFSLKR